MNPRLIRAGRDVKLDPVLQRIADRTGTAVKYGTFNSNSSQGMYDPRQNIAYVSRNAIDQRASIIHELGHAKDFEKRMRPQKSWRATFGAIPKSEMNRIVVNRYNRYVDPSERVRTIAQVERRLDKKYLNYLKSSHEVFADGYSQFIRGAKDMRSVSPTTYEYFQSIRTI